MRTHRHHQSVRRSKGHWGSAVNGRPGGNPNRQVHGYELLESRRLLAIFPVYINGILTLGNPDPNAPSPYPLSETFNLSTNPSATKTIYLDFNGHLSLNNEWGHNINFPAYDRDGNAAAFSDAELIEIQLMFQNVAEDFSPFDVNLTTREPALDALIRSGAGDTVYGMRTVHTQATDGFGDGIGGVAYLNSFGSPDDTPCFAFNKGVNNGAMTISHEVGHTLGLRHDGLNSQAYHPGTGSGATSWGPIMGAPFGKNVVHWSRGDYSGANNTEDDFALITQPSNGFGFKPDDYGNTIATASLLPVVGNNVSTYGFIGRNNDVDVFRFKAGAGTSTFSIKPFQVNPNLDILATIYNNQGAVVATFNPLDEVVADFSLSLANGTYYLAIDGTGKSGVYSEYGSLGFYTIDANIPTPANTIGETSLITGLTSQWRTITLQNVYTNPVIVMGTPTRLGLDPVTIRVRNIKSSSFDVRVDEWEYQDGQHGREDVSFLVIEAGTYDLPNGTRLQAGKSTVSHRWQTVLYNDDVVFEQQPILLSQVVSTNEPVAVTTRHRNVGSASFEIRVQEEEAADRVHLAEAIHWIAVEPGRGSLMGSVFEAGQTPTVVNHLNYTVDFQSTFSPRPNFFAQMQTFNGGDPSTVRQTNLASRSAQLFIEEERSFDNEVQHNPERVGWLALESGEVVLPPPAAPPAPLQMAARGGSQSPVDDPLRLAAAAEIQRQWGEDTLPLGGHENHCCCSDCAGLSVLDESVSQRTANFVLGITPATSFVFPLLQIGRSGQSSDTLSPRSTERSRSAQPNELPSRVSQRATRNYSTGVSDASKSDRRDGMPDSLRVSLDRISNR